MAISSTTFEERIARIHQRAAQGDNVGFVTPGVAEEPISPRAAKKLAKAQSKSRGSYAMSILGGLATSFAIVGIGAVVLLNDANAGGLEELAAAFLPSSK
ncbi:hypothetical protein [Aestuariivita boseongensis]|uniref:hypothetical protein n=1 Tax=Aestuariivita boseongensis TaxID=1470562 RepID=UPI0006826C54|nr:hypothetical protein [Aestuariivita boseongensis]